MFLQTRIIVDGAKFSSHDSGSYFYESTFKNGYWKKKLIFFVTELKLQVIFSMQSQHGYTLLIDIKKFQLFRKKKKIGDEAEVVQCSFKDIFVENGTHV